MTKVKQQVWVTYLVSNNDGERKGEWEGRGVFIWASTSASCPATGVAIIPRKVKVEKKGVVMIVLMLMLMLWLPPTW